MTNINKGKHTHGPWHTDDTGLEPTSWINIYPKNEECLPLCSVRHYSKELKANAKFIVEACNSHYELLEALNEMIYMAEKLLNREPVRNVEETLSFAKSVSIKAEGDDND